MTDWMVRGSAPTVADPADRHTADAIDFRPQANKPGTLRQGWYVLED
jgi:hypothetical protein